MKLEHKIGVAVTCAFLCLTGAVIGLKMQEQTPPESPSIATADRAEPITPIQETPPDSRSHAPRPISPLGNDLTPSPDGGDSRGSAGKRANQSGSSSSPSSQKQTPTAAPINPRSSSAGNNGSVNGQKGTPTIRDEKPMAGSPSTVGNPSTFTFNGPTTLGIDGPTSTKRRPKTIESLVLMPIDGTDQWGLSRRNALDTTSQPEPRLSRNNVEPAPVISKPSQTPKPPEPATSPPATSIITRTSDDGALMTLGPLPPPISSSTSPSAPPPVGPGQGSSSTPSGTGSVGSGASASGQTLPPLLQDQPVNSQNTLDSRTKDTISAPPSQTRDQPPEQSKLSPTPRTPPPAPLGSPPPTTVAPPTPPSMPSSSPNIVPYPPSTPAQPVTPAPVPSITPPNPPAEGSSFMPDHSSAAPPGGGTSSGSVGVMPAPLPLPTPPSSPLGSGSDKPVASAGTQAPPQPVSKGPSVTVYDEQDYSCQSGDSWGEISKHFYQTDQYAKALQRHNQNHARASDQMMRTGQIAPGERVFIPQAYILEERYADAITKPAVTPASTTIPASSVIPGGSIPAPAPLPANSLVPLPNTR